MPSDLKQVRAGLRREHILAAARQVFAERGYRGATIRHIAQIAGVADGTIYNSFANKAELLIKLIEQLADAVPHAPGQTPPPNAHATLAEMLAKHWTAFTPELLETLRVALSEALVDADLGSLILDRVLTPAIAPLEHALRSSGDGTINPLIASRTIVATVIGLAVLRLLGDRTIAEEWATIPDHLAPVFSRDLQPG